MKYYSISFKMFSVLAICIFSLFLSACTGNSTAIIKYSTHTYKLKESVEVSGRQGIAVSDEYYYVSGSKTLTKYDKDWNVVSENTDPFSNGYDNEVNHISDIDVYNNEIYCGVELFLDGKASNIQIAVYDADTLKLSRSFNFEPESGQTECSGICVDPDNQMVWMCSWGDGETACYLYKYDLNSGKYAGKLHLHPIPRWIQGVAYFDGNLYVTADDGDANYDEPDHIYKVLPDENGTSASVFEEYELTDVTRQGEIEGLSFDEKNKELLVLYNRGARVILGMPSGFYEGYDHEISEVFVYGFE